MKFLVAGSEGSLMQSVIPKLLANKHEVIGADNLIKYNKRKNNDDRYKFEKIDLTISSDVNNIFKNYKPDYVIQSAARLYGIGGFNKYCADILGDDLTLHNNLLKASVRNNVKRFIYISSSMVYETCPQPANEDMLKNIEAPRTDYGLSKFVGERLCRAFWKQYNLEYVIWRPANIITPYEISEGELGISHVFSDYIKRIILDKVNELEIIGDGLQIRCFTWIEEVAQAIADYSILDEAKNDAFNLSSEEPVTMRQLAKIIHNIGVELGYIQSKSLNYKIIKTYENDVRVRLLSADKVFKTFGWKAKQKINESIKICIKNAIGDI